MNFQVKTVVSISEIKKQVQAGECDKAIESLDRLWKVLGRVERNDEVLSCGYLHTEETLEKARKENSIIQGSIQYPHEIILSK